MHLIKTSTNSIDDFENGLTYTLASMPDYESGDIFHSLWRRHWNHKGATDSADVTHGHTALRIWKHLESILAFDAAKDDPQPAPAKAEICEGDTVGIIGTKYFGEVLKIRTQDGGRQYFLKRAYNLSEDQFLGWFAENMLDPENNVPNEYAAPSQDTD